MSSTVEDITSDLSSPVYIDSTEVLFQYLYLTMSLRLLSSITYYVNSDETYLDMFLTYGGWRYWLLCSWNPLWHLFGECWYREQIRQSLPTAPFSTWEVCLWNNSQKWSLPWSHQVHSNDDLVMFMLTQDAQVTQRRIKYLTQD